MSYQIPLISVVIPVYNREKSIKQCINSVLDQSYSNLEILVIDDLSKDNTVQIVQSINSDKVKLILSDKKIFAQGARNLGIKSAKGDWIVFLDSDDVLTEHSILLRYNIVKESPNIDFVYGDVSVDNRICQFKNMNNKSNQEIKLYILKELCLCPFSVIMARKKSIEQIGYLDEKYLAWQDDSFVLSFIIGGFNIKHCENIVAKMYISDNSISLNFKNRLQGVSRIVSIYKEEIINTHGKYRYFLWKLRILLNKIKVSAKKNNLIIKLLENFLSTQFEHIWG